MPYLSGSRVTDKELGMVSNSYITVQYSESLLPFQLAMVWLHCCLSLACLTSENLMMWTLSLIEEVRNIGYE